MWLQASIYNSGDLMGEYEVLPSDTLLETLTFRLPPYQSLQLCLVH